MDQYKNFVDSLKELFNDVIGFLIPGFLYILVFSISINESFFLNFQSSALSKSLAPWIILISSYLLGYITFGFSLCFSSCRTKLFRGYTVKIESKIQNSRLFTDSLAKYKLDNVTIAVSEQISIRELRTRVMSSIPESDNKIYSFRFRSDFCENSSKVLWISLIIIAILAMVRSCFVDEIVLLTLSHFIFYFILPISAYLLGVVRDRYYDIAMRLPLSIYLSKN